MGKEERQMTNFGTRLRKLIMEKGQSRAEFARDCELSDDMVYRFIMAKRLPSHHTLRKIAVNLSPADLYWLITGHNS